MHFLVLEICFRGGGPDPVRTTHYTVNGTLSSNRVFATHCDGPRDSSLSTTQLSSAPRAIMKQPYSCNVRQSPQARRALGTRARICCASPSFLLCRAPFDEPAAHPLYAPYTHIDTNITWIGYQLEFRASGLTAGSDMRSAARRAVLVRIGFARPQREPAIAMR